MARLPPRRRTAEAVGRDGVAAGAAAPARWQCRRGAAGPGAGTRHYGVAAYAGAGGCAVPAGAGGGGPGDVAVRDAAGPAVADRLRSEARGDRRRDGAGVFVRGDAGLFAVAVRA